MEEPKKGHGNRKYLQILLAPHRGKLFIEHVESLKETEDETAPRPSAFIRDMIYEYLKKTLDKDIYQEALEKDQLEWEESVHNRLEGRALSKLLNSIRKSGSP